MIKVNAKTGNVTRDDVVIGSVVKRTSQTISSMIMGTDGPTVWVPLDNEGNEVARRTFDTRKAAVNALDKATQPPTVSDIKVGENWITRNKYVSAWISWEGNSASVSRYASETDWFVDSLFLSGAIMPTFSHGEGDRSCAKRALLPEQAALVSEAVEREIKSGALTV